MALFCRPSIFPSLILLPPLLCFAQAESRRPTAETSHQERFAGPRAALERKERDLSVRLAQDPGNAQLLSERGVTRMRLQRDAEALIDLVQSAAMDTASADVQANLAYGYLAVRRFPEALKAAQAALLIDPRHASAHFYFGRIILETGGELHEAIAHLEKAAERSPGDLDIQLEAFAAYRRAGDLSRAALQLSLLRMLLPPQHSGILYSEGLLQADLGNLRVAIERFRQALTANPALDSVRQDLGVALVQTSHWQEAAETLAPLVQSRPDSFVVAYFHSLALKNSQRASEAEAEARRALALRPDSVDAHALVGIILAGRGAHAEALEALTRAVQLDPKNFDAQFYLGRARYALRDLPGSRDAFRAALAIRPDDVEARFFLATVLEAAGEKDPAIAEYRELVSRRPQDARGYIGLGAVLAKYGEVEPALQQLRRAREMAPQDFEAALALGRLLVKEGRVEEGIKSLEESVALAPSSPEAHYQLGLALRRVGRTAEAQREFATVEQLNRQRRAAGGMGSPEEKQ